MVRRHGQRDLLMPSSIGEEPIHMAELREAHPRYLLAIYELAKAIRMWEYRRLQNSEPLQSLRHQMGLAEEYIPMMS